MTAGVLRFAVLAVIAATGAWAGQSIATFEPKLKAAVKLSPDSFESNYNLGELYLHAGRLLDAIPYMEKAQLLQPSHYESGYDLALAYFKTRNYSKARGQIQAMLSRRDSAELHSLLADVEEAAGDYLTAAQEYQRAARMDLSEEHIFAWGSELLTHQTFGPAVTVFRQGLELFPKSAKLEAGFGIALYFQGSYEQAVKALCLATDLDPSESWPYLFLGKLYTMASANSIANTDEVRKRLALFARLQPKNARALYYYAMSLWTREQGPPAGLVEVESLLRQAIARDPNFSEAHLQLGILLMDCQKNAEAIREFQRTIAIEPNLTTAHYHLAQAYMRTGQSSRGQEQLQAFERLRKQDQAETEKGRKEVLQFVIDMKEQTPGAPAR